MDAVRVRIANWTGPLVRPASARLTVDHFTHNGIAAEIVTADGKPAATFAPLGMVTAEPTAPELAARLTRAIADAEAARLTLDREGQKGVPVSDAGLAAAHAVVERQRRADECFDALERAAETDSEER